MPVALEIIRIPACHSPFCFLAVELSQILVDLFQLVPLFAAVAHIRGLDQL